MINKIKYFIASRLIKLMSDYNQSLCYLNCSAPNGTFIDGSKVCNFQNDKTKIIIGIGGKIRAELLVFANGGVITIGKNVYVGEYSRIWSAESITIGDDVLISHNVNICDTNSHELDHNLRAENYKKMLKEGHPKEKGQVKTKPIVIENNVWIGFNSIIHKGVTIGEGAIISAGSVVFEDVAAFCVVSGNPAKIVKYLN